MKATAIAVQTLAVLAISIASAHARLDWDAHARNAVAIARLQQPIGESVLALVRAAMSQVSRSGTGNGTNAAHALDYNTAAASLAAYVILECLFPDQQPGLEYELAVTLADFPETQQKADALVQGRQVATEVLRSAAQVCGSGLKARL